MDELSIQVADNLTMKCSMDMDTVTIEATVPTGLEVSASTEVANKFRLKKSEIAVSMGRLLFSIPIKEHNLLSTLRSIDNVNVIAAIVENVKYCNENLLDINEIKKLLDKTDLVSAAKKFCALIKCDRNSEPTQEEGESAKIKHLNMLAKVANNEMYDSTSDEYTHNVLRYRVTCDRVGTHSFTSMEAARAFGGEINDRYHWVVALTHWDINVILHLSEDRAMIGFQLYRKSLHHRNLTYFGPTTLRPTIAYGMLALANLQDNDIVVDPMCGGGSIPIECVYAFPNVSVICGDIYGKAIERANKNVAALPDNVIKPIVHRWNAKELPFKDNEIDVIVTDLPFGKRCGSKRENENLYRSVIEEFARVLKLGTGRMVLLSHDANHLYAAVKYKQASSVWDIQQRLTVNVGGLKCLLMVARRKRRNKAVNVTPTP